MRFLPKGSANRYAALTGILEGFTDALNLYQQRKIEEANQKLKQQQALLEQLYLNEQIKSKQEERARAEKQDTEETQKKDEINRAFNIVNTMHEHSPDDVWNAIMTLERYNVISQESRQLYNNAYAGYLAEKQLQESQTSNAPLGAITTTPPSPMSSLMAPAAPLSSPVTTPTPPATSSPTEPTTRPLSSATTPTAGRKPQNPVARAVLEEHLQRQEKDTLDKRLKELQLQVYAQNLEEGKARTAAFEQEQLHKKTLYPFEEREAQARADKAELGLQAEKQAQERELNRIDTINRMSKAFHDRVNESGHTAEVKEYLHALIDTEAEAAKFNPNISFGSAELRSAVYSSESTALEVNRKAQALDAALKANGYNENDPNYKVIKQIALHKELLGENQPLPPGLATKLGEMYSQGLDPKIKGTVANVLSLTFMGVPARSIEELVLPKKEQVPPDVVTLNTKIALVNNAVSRLTKNPDDKGAKALLITALGDKSTLVMKALGIDVPDELTQSDITNTEKFIKSRSAEDSANVRAILSRYGLIVPNANGAGYTVNMAPREQDKEAAQRALDAFYKAKSQERGNVYILEDDVLTFLSHLFGENYTSDVSSNYNNVYFSLPYPYITRELTTSFLSPSRTSQAGVGEMTTEQKASMASGLGAFGSVQSLPSPSNTARTPASPRASLPTASKKPVDINVSMASNIYNRLLTQALRKGLPITGLDIASEVDKISPQNRDAVLRALENLLQRKP
jgi:hypothetical protein